MVFFAGPTAHGARSAEACPMDDKLEDPTQGLALRPSVNNYCVSFNLMFGLPKFLSAGTAHLLGSRGGNAKRWSPASAGLRQ